MKKIILSSVLSSLLITGVLDAKETASKTASIKEVNKVAIVNAKSDAEGKASKLAEEALVSLKDVRDSLAALEKNNVNDATHKLESALGRLEVILASKEVPKELPINVAVSINEFKGTSSEIDMILNSVRVLLNKNKVQEARALMLPLQSEIDITTISLPLGSYPEALKLAAKYMHSNDLDKAKDILKIALNTFSSVTEVLPIPLAQATDLILASEVLAKEDKDRALLYLSSASESLKIAHKLGYVSKSETTYKMLEDEIKAVKKEIEGPNKAEKLFENLKTSLKEFKEKIFSKKLK